jgi:chromate transport protein ChrA
MHYLINLLHDGFIPACLSFFIWRYVILSFYRFRLYNGSVAKYRSLPGAFGMFGLAQGIASIGTSLPDPVYALLSGLNASTVGIIVLAAVQLSEKAITDKLTRLLVFFGAAAGMLYNALWYFPLLMFVGGSAALVYDFRWLHKPMEKAVGLLRKITRRGDRQTSSTDAAPAAAASSARSDEVPMHPRPQGARTESSLANPDVSSDDLHAQRELPTDQVSEEMERVVPADRQLNFSWKVGTGIILAFFATFITIITLRSTALSGSLLFRFFGNMYLAGTIIFGGGPVVIPLLSEYVVAEGWVSPRDFLIGLAIQQAVPGPNFNFAVYLGALTAKNGGHSAALGALLGYIGIFAPGLVIAHGTMGIWSAVRSSRAVKSFLKGLNATAVGLIYTAVYRLWQIGYVDEGFQQGSSLGLEPWWVVVTASSYVGGYWFGVSPPVAIVGGVVLGLIWFAIVSD